MDTRFWQTGFMQPGIQPLYLWNVFYTDSEELVPQELLHKYSTYVSFTATKRGESVINNESDHWILCKCSQDSIANL